MADRIELDEWGAPRDAVDTLARRFDRVCEVLTDLGYLTSAGDAATVTESGRLLMRLYTEADLLTSQAIMEGLWDGLSPKELAAVCAAVVYEARRADDDEPAQTPTRIVREALQALHYNLLLHRSFHDE